MICSAPLFCRVAQVIQLILIPVTHKILAFNDRLEFTVSILAIHFLQVLRQPFIQVFTGILEFECRNIDAKTSEIAFNYLPVCKCIAYAFISNFIGNLILRGCKTACKFVVVTTHAEEINEEIITKLKHTSTQIL